MKFKTITQILSIGMILIPFRLWSQNSEIQGKITDNETLQAVPYCSISLRNTSIGTCSNDSGKFIFHFPDSLINRDLIITCIGYKTRSIKLDSLLTNTTASFLLTPELYHLPEVNVTPDKISASDLVRQAIRRMHKNYPRSPYYIECFLRDKVYNLFDNKCTRLTEAAVGIEKKEFGNENNAEKVKVLEIRNSYNYSKLGNSIKEKINQILFGYSNDNPIYRTLQNKDFTDSGTLRELLRNDLYRTSISGNTMLDGKQIVIIDIKEEYVEFLFHKQPTKNAYHLYRLYIDNESSAILKTESYTIMHFSKNSFTDVESVMHLKQDTIATFAAKQYEQIDGQYYLKYATYLGRIHDQPDIGETGKTLYLNETNILVNETITKKRDFERIKLRNSLKKDIPLWDMKYTYNKAFWENYNILIDNPIDLSVKSDLESAVPLDNQFNDSGLKNSKK